MHNTVNNISSEEFISYHTHFGYLIKEAITNEYKYGGKNTEITRKSMCDMLEFISEYLWECFSPEVLQEWGLTGIHPFGTLINENILISIQINTRDGKVMTLPYLIYNSYKQENNLSDPYTC